MICCNIKELSVRQAVSSYIIKNELITSSSNNFCVEISDSRQDDGSNLIVTLDEGKYNILYESVEMIYVVSKGDQPIAGRVHDRDATVLENHYINSYNYSKILKLIRVSVDEKNPDLEKRFSTFIWNARNEIWRRDCSVPERSLDSVILDDAVKEKLKKDLDDFTDYKTINWYRDHCIPFKRGYLFYGKPGTGKTSTISAIASYLKRKVYRLNLVAPGLCDNSLLEAVNSIKKNSILVMEDIDSLFGVHREKNESFSTTFSGLLNAIDGLGDSKGHIFIMTSNYPEKIDKALRRKGRVDLEIEFDSCTKEQARKMFLKFYPNEESDAESFSKEVISGNYTPADLQHHFIFHRKNSSSFAKKIDSKLLKQDETEWKNIYT
jgi:SpoVK/Ycf46/Vps4 family AAA+-type ATPase